ncbi:cyclic nucleotide-binding domain-containing protein, partial [Corynebacterium propinquum]
YVASGFIAELARKGDVRNQLLDLAHRHLEAAGISRHPDGVIEPSSRARALLDEVKVFRSLSHEERDRLAESMVPQQYSAGQVVLDLDEVPDSLFVIATGIVSVSGPDRKGLAAAGRMGPSEVMGEQSILADTPSQATFTALTSPIIYRLDKQLTRQCMAQRSEVGQALNKLQAVRQQNSRLALMAKPVPVRKGGFLGWLQKR